MQPTPTQQPSSNARFLLAGQRNFLRLLAPYLAEKIDIYHPATGRYGVLHGLPATYAGQYEPLADVEFYADAEAREEGGGDLLEPYGKILPVLYGFKDLATELMLADGRRVVPAVEVARLTNGNLDIDSAEWERDFFGNPVLVVCRGAVRGWSIYEEDFISGGAHFSLKAADLLRSLHFAVGLRPEQYHRKQVAPVTSQTELVSVTDCDCACDGCGLCVNPDWTPIKKEVPSA